MYSLTVLDVWSAAKVADWRKARNLYRLYLLIGGNARVLSFPFILHPLFGLIAAGVAHMAIKGGPFRRLGRWAPLASLLVLVIATIMLVRTA